MFWKFSESKVLAYFTFKPLFHRFKTLSWHIRTDNLYERSVLGCFGRNLKLRKCLHFEESLYFQIHQGANQTHWNRFRAKYGCLQKIPMDSKMSPFFYKIFSSHFESREPGFLQRIILVLTLCNSPTTIWACSSQLKPKIWL